MSLLADFYGPNAAYVLDLYERFRQDPGSVDPATRAYFERHPPLELLEGVEAPLPVPSAALDKVAGLVNLANAIREYGHLAAQLDPLGSPPPGDPSLELSYHHLTEEDLHSLPPGPVGGPIARRAATASIPVSIARPSTTMYRASAAASGA